jgi:hypothetical protein
MLKLPRILSLLVLPLAVTACAGSTPSIEPPKLAAVDRELAKDCDNPTILPDRELTQAEAERYWAQDRFKLVVCRDRHRETIRFFTFRDNGITGKQAR